MTKGGKHTAEGRKRPEAIANDILRDASTVGAGDTVHVRLERGELKCEVHSTSESIERRQRTQTEDL